MKGNGRDKQAYLVMEFCPGGHLFDKVAKMARNNAT